MVERGGWRGEGGTLFIGRSEGSVIIISPPPPQDALTGADGGGVKLPKELSDTLSQLAQLSNYKNSPVALRAREVLITSSQPSYQLRYNQVESIFISAIEDETFSVSELEVRRLLPWQCDVQSSLCCGVLCVAWQH